MDFYRSSLNDRLEQRLTALNRVNDVRVKSVTASFSLDSKLLGDNRYAA